MLTLSGGLAGSLNGIRVGRIVGSGSPVHRLGGAVCRHHVQFPASAPDTSEVAGGLGLLYLIIPNRM